MKIIVKKILVLILSLVIVLSGIQVYAKKQVAKAYTAHTAEEAIAWAASKVGQRLEGDNYYGNNNSYAYQCVDFIMCYYEYLGVPHSNGNGEAYAYNSLPSGWTRVKGGKPQKGDILVYSGNAFNPMGHVAIYESERSTYHQNFNNCQKVTHETYRYDGISNPYWGYIRPDWSTAHNPFGCVDTCESQSYGKLSISGWAIDEDNYGAQLYIHVYIGPEDNAAAYNIGLANTYRPDVDNIYHCGQYHGFDKIINTDRTGYQRVRVFAINTGGGDNKLLYDGTVYIKSDNEKPECYSYSIKSLRENGYNITLLCSDNVKVANVKLAIKPTDKTSDWVFYEGYSDNGGYCWDFTFADGCVGKEYDTNVYIYDEAGNCTSFLIDPIKLGKDTEPPTIKSSNIYQESPGELTFKMSLMDDYGLGEIRCNRKYYYSSDANSGGFIIGDDTVTKSDNCFGFSINKRPIVAVQKDTEVQEIVTCDGIRGYEFIVYDLAGNDTYKLLKSSEIIGLENNSEEVTIKSGETVKLGDITSRAYTGSGNRVMLDVNNERILKKSMAERNEDIELTGNEEGVEYIYFMSIGNGYVWSCKVIVTSNDTNLDNTTTSHTHNYGFEWRNNKTNHWKECECGEKKDVASHIFVWKEDQAPTTTQIGKKHEECSVCGYKKNIVEIPKVDESACNNDSLLQNNYGNSSKSNSNGNVNYNESNLQGNKNITAKSTQDTYRNEVSVPGITTVMSCKSDKHGKVCIKWYKVASANGYQIQYSTKKNFVRKKTKVVYGSKLKLKLKSNKKYYVRVRAYRKASGNKVYGKWSKVKKIKVKK